MKIPEPFLWCNICKRAYYPWNICEHLPEHLRSDKMQDGGREIHREDVERQMKLIQEEQFKTAPPPLVYELWKGDDVKYVEARSAEEAIAKYPEYRTIGKVYTRLEYLKLLKEEPKELSIKEPPTKDQAIQAILKVTEKYSPTLHWLDTMIVYDAMGEMGYPSHTTLFERFSRETFDIVSEAFKELAEKGYFEFTEKPHFYARKKESSPEIESKKPKPEWLRLNFHSHILGLNATNRLKNKQVVQTIRSDTEIHKLGLADIDIYLDGNFIGEAHIESITKAALAHLNLEDAKRGGFDSLGELHDAARRAGYRFKPLEEYWANRVLFQWLGD